MQSFQLPANKRRLLAIALAVLAVAGISAAIFGVFALTFPWMLRVISGFSIDLIRRLPEFIR